MAQEQFSSVQEQLRLKKVSINGIDVIREHISMIEIFESITQPGMTGFIDIMDFQAIVEKGNIFADDKIKITFTVEGQNDLNLEYVINSNEGGKMLPNQQYNTARLGFCSAWLIPALSKTVSKHYSDKFIHEILQDLVEECGGKVGFIEPTKQKLEIFVSPLWSPYHTMKYLMKFALNESGKGGYLCWTDMKTDKVNITTVDKMISGYFGRFDTFKTFTKNPNYHGRIHHLTVETNYDIIRLVQNGAANTKLYGFNYDTKAPIISDDGISKIKQGHLSKKLPVPSKYTSDKKFASVKFCPLFPNTKASIGGDDSKLKDLLDGALQAEYSMLVTDAFKINILTGGDPDRRAGQIASLDFPSQNVNVEGHTNEIYKQYVGDYLIRDINHTFSFFSEYKQAICLAADGFKILEREATSWG